MLQALKLNRILASHFELLIFTKDSYSPNFRLIPLEGSVWQQVQAKSTSRSEDTAGSEVQIWHSDRQEAPDINEYV
jgi:hypothetical protein